MKVDLNKEKEIEQEKLQIKNNYNLDNVFQIYDGKGLDFKQHTENSNSNNAKREECNKEEEEVKNSRV